jgi:uncharacterized repeat protein (TIGR01451 family)
MQRTGFGGRPRGVGSRRAGVRALAAVALGFAPVWGNAQTFHEAPAFDAGLRPPAVAVGDFNDDGDDDLVVADSGSNLVSILLGDGAGAFGAPTSFAVGSFPRALVVADFDGDANLDVAVANSGSNNVSVLLGNGDGSLDTALNYPAGGVAFNLAAADFNGDTETDLAVANSTSDNVAILLGNGSGGFGGPTSYAAGTTPRAVAVGDLDDDGELDLAVANGDSNNVSVLLGDGLGGFGAPTNFGAGTGPFGVALGDFNGDTNLDLAVANDDSGDVTVNRGNGLGGFAAPISWKAGFRPHAVVIGDFNSDSKQDLAVTNFGSNTVTVRLGDGAGGFGLPAGYGAGTAPYGVALADLNGDGDLDLATANFHSDNVSVLAGVGNGKFDAAPAYDVGASPTAVAPGDFNEDGRLDVVVTDSGANDVAVLLGTVSGGLAPADFFAAGAAPQSVGVGNFNAGLHLDLAVANSQGDDVSILLSNGPGSFGSPVEFPVEQGPSSVAVGDLNGDAKPDLAVANHDSDDTSILLGDGNGGFVPAGNPGVGDQPAHLVIGLFDANAHPDLAVANMGSNDVSILLGDGLGGFSDGLSYPVALQPRSIALGDFDQDGNTDLAVADTGANRVSILLGDGLGAFGAASHFLAGQGPTSVAVGDFNGDALLDVAVANSVSENVSILSGDGHGAFVLTRQTGVGRGAISLGVGDFNGDDKVDLAVVNQDSDSLWLLLNTTIFERADLEIDKDDGQTETAPGAPISYEIVVTNHGPHTVTSLTVTDDLPPEILSPVFTPETGIYDSQTGEWTGLNLGNGQSVTLTLDGTIDPNADSDVVNTVTVEPPIGVGDPVPGNNTDTDIDAVFSLSIDDQTLTEVPGGGTMTFHVSLNGASAETVTVDYTTANGSAHAGSDYTAVSGTLTFAPGVLTLPIVVQVAGDVLSEANETFFVELSDASGANIGDALGLGTIVDDDPPPSLAIGDVSVAEGNSGNTPMGFTVTLSTPSGQTVTVDYETSDGSAQAGSDYTAASGTLTIPAGAPTGTITVQLKGDVDIEDNELFFASLSNASSATIVDGLGKGTILDDDSPPRISVDDVQVVEQAGGASAVFTVSLSAPTSFPVTVDYQTADGTAIAGADYTAVSGTLSFGPLETAQVVTVPILADAALESTEHYFVNLSDPTNASLSKGHGQGWILDQSAGQRLQFSSATYNVAESKATATVSVKRIGPKTGIVTVDYEASDGTAVSGQDYTAVAGTLTFNAGVVTRTFTIPITNDTIVDGGGESVLLTLSNPTGVGVLGAPSAAMLTLADNDSGGKLYFSKASYSVGETGPVATLTVKRSNGLASGVTVAYATSDGTATAGADYTATSGTLTFAAGVTSQTVNVPVLEDALAEGDETFSVTLSAPGGGGTLGVPSTATVTIVENESTLQLGSASYSIGEGGSATITVKRSGSKTGIVTVDYATADGTAIAGSDYAATAGVLTFPNGIAVKTFKVPIIGDTLQEVSETFSVSLSNPTGGASLGLPSSATVSIADNDTAGTLQFKTAAYSVSETKTSATITVKRTGGKASGVTVDFATSDGTGVAGVDYVATSGTLSFGPGVVSRTFTVTILNDGVPGPDETVNLTLSNPGGGGVLGVPAAAVLTILSDDPILQFNAATYSVGENGPVATITVQRLGPKSASVSVDYSTADGTATAGSDYTATSGTLSFAPNVVNRTFTIPIADDTQVEPTETVLLSLSDPAGGGALGARANAVLDIVTDNSMLQFSATEYSGTEKGGKVTITVTRALPKTGVVTVNYATSNGSALAGTDYAATSGVLTFASGVVKKTFTVPIINDTLSEAPETLNVSLSGPGGGSFLGPDSAAVVAITSDDSGGTLQLDASSYSVSELGPVATITVKRSGGTASGVTIDYAATPGSAVPNTDFVAASGTLFFDSGETSKTFSVLILNDEVADGNKTVNIELSNPGGGGTLGAQASSVLWIVDWP